MPSTTRRVNASRANGALSRGPKTEAGKARVHLNAVKTGAFAKTIVLNNESTGRLDRLRNEYNEYVQPTNPIERDLVEEMVICKWLTRRAWRLESSSVNYKMDEQKEAVEAKHFRIKEPSRTAIAHQDMYDNSSALPQIQRNQNRNLRAFHRALRQLEELRRKPAHKNAQSNLVPISDTAAAPENPSRAQRRPSRRHRILRRLLQPATAGTQTTRPSNSPSPHSAR